MTGWIILIALVAVVTGCRSAAVRTPGPPVGLLQRYEFKGAQMGTLFTITLYASNGPVARDAADAAFARINALNDIMSDYQADSELMLLCDKPAGIPVPVSVDLFDVLARAQEISRRTSGAFDVTVGPYVRLWRFARKRKVLPASQELAQARAVVGYRHLRLDARKRTATLTLPGMRLDLGGIAKGYAADEAIKVLKSKGIASALVAASGDIALSDPPPGQKGWRVGVAPIDARSDAVAEMLLLHNCGISTSGDSEQFIEIGGVRYSHIIDPRTGLGLTNRIQATIVAPDATATDALATSVCILGGDKGMAAVRSFSHASAMILTRKNDQGELKVSPGFRKLPRPDPSAGPEPHLPSPAGS